jgi:glycosyltransferase involved in cell wall biosynthesis
MMRQRNDASSSRARVVHVTSVHPGCDVRILIKECQSLARAGYEVIELTNDPQDGSAGGVRIKGLGESRSRWHRVTTKLFQIGFESFRINANIYHIHDPELLPIGMMLRLFRKCVIYDIHEDLPGTVPYKEYIPAWLRQPIKHLVKFAETVAAHRMSGLVAATPAIARRFQAINRNTVVVNNFPVASELAPLEEKEWSQRKISVCYIGGIGEGRGIRELLSATGQLTMLGVKLELAGWFSERVLYDELARTPEWQHVKWLGVLDRQAIAKLLSEVRAGLVVFHPEPNCVEAQPNKLFEYMSAGIPVIASDFPLWREIIAKTGCGILVDPHDPSAIADAISYLLTHDSEAEAMGRRGRAAVEKQFNWQQEECKLLAFYTKLAGNGSLGVM